MKKPVFTGASVAIITPFTADNKINFEEYVQAEIKDAIKEGKNGQDSNKH